MKILGKALAFDPAQEAIAAERAGYDGVRVIDHFFSGIAPEPQRAVSHGIAGLAAAAAVTDRVLLTTTMLSAPIRHPAECRAGDRDDRSHLRGPGRAGIGAGWNRAEFDAVGLDLGSPRDRLDRVIEAATICHAMFEQKGVVDFEGRFFRARCNAEWPSTPHVPEVMVAAHGPRAIRLAAAVANRIDLLESMPEGIPVLDEMHVNSRERLAERIAMARGAASTSGNTLAFSATVMLQITPDAPARDRARARSRRFARSSVELLELETLRMIDTGDGAMARFSALGALGFERLHIRPSDESSQRWLDEALPDLRVLGSS